MSPFSFWKSCADLSEKEGRNYDIGGKRGGPRVSTDWHMTFYRATWLGRPCCYPISPPTK